MGQKEKGLLTEEKKTTVAVTKRLTSSTKRFVHWIVGGVEVPLPAPLKKQWLQLGLCGKTRRVAFVAAHTAEQMQFLMDSISRSLVLLDFGDKPPGPTMEALKPAMLTSVWEEPDGSCSDGRWCLDLACPLNRLNSANPEPFLPYMETAKDLANLRDKLNGFASILMANSEPIFDGRGTYYAKPLITVSGGEE